MSVNGQVQTPFSGRTLDLQYPAPGKDYAAECIAAAMKRYCTPLRPQAAQRAVL
jgi:hypothetical protein